MPKQQAQLMKLMQQQMQDSVVTTFNAGKMTYNVSSKTVKADKKRGKIQVKKVLTEAGLFDFEWSERNSNRPTFRRKLIPGLVTWKKCGDCKDGRVYVLQIVGSDPVFFWMQEVNEEKDKEVYDKLTTTFSPQTQTTTNTTNNTTTAPNAAATNFQSMLQQALLSAQQNPSGTGTASQPSAQQQQAQQAQQQLLQAQEQMRQMIETDPDLDDVFPPNRAAEIVEKLDDESFKQLIEHLPEELRTREDLVQHISSPQFRTAASSLSSVFRSGDSGPLYSEMGLNNSTNPSPGVLAFLDAVNETFATNDNKEEENDKDKKEDKDEEMDG